MNFARGLKARDLLIAPKGCDTTALSNPKWGESTAGALFVDTCNNRLYFYNGLKWNQVTGGGGGVDSFYYNFRNLNDTTLLWDRGDGTVDTLAFSSGGTSLIGAYIDDIKAIGQDLYYYKNGDSTFIVNIAQGSTGGDTTIFSFVVDTTNVARFQIPYADTTGYFKGDTALTWQPSDKTLVTDNLYMYGTDASRAAKMWFKIPNPTFGYRPRIYAGMLPTDVANGAIYFSGGGSNALMEINSGDNNDLLFHSPDGSMLFKQTDGLYRYYYLPTNTSTRKVLVTDDSGFVAWNVIDSLVSSLGGGGGGITGIGTFSGTGNAKGLSISGTDLIMHPATSTTPGGVSTGDQTWAGQKTLVNNLIFANAAGGSGPTIDFGLNFNQAALWAFNGGAGTRYGLGVTTNTFNFFVPSSTGVFNFKTGGDLSGGASVAQITSAGVFTTNTINPQLIDCGTTANTNKLFLFNIGAGFRWGFGVNSGGFQEFMYDVPRTWNRGGDRQANGVNELMRIDPSTGIFSVNNASPDASAILQATSTTRGFLQPRMTTTQQNAISSPATGLQVFNTTLSQPHYRDGSTWQAQVGMTFGTAAPTSTPTAVGNFFLDTTNKKLYVATGTASSSDWTILN